jgi:cell division protein FtsB
MREFQHKKSIQKMFYSRYALLLYAILLLFMGNAVYGAYGKYRQGRSLETNANREFETLQERRGYLSEHIKSIEGDKGKEAEVLDRFGMVKQGEHLIVLYGDENNTEEKVKKSAGVFGWLKGFFLRN